MVDDTMPGGESIASICPWCSATYQGHPEQCPSCNATFTGETAVDPSLPGLTAIDAAAIVRSKEPVKKSRNRLLSWISGEYPDEAPPASEAEALAPPDLAVRREMLRLELQAEVANLQAEADAIMAEAVVDGRSSAAASPDVAADDAAAGATDVAGPETGDASPGDAKPG